MNLEQISNGILFCSYLDRHEAICSYNEVPCPGCGTVRERITMFWHVEGCSDIEIVPLEQSGPLVTGRFNLYRDTSIWEARTGVYTSTRKLVYVLRLPWSINLQVLVSVVLSKK